MYFCHVYETNSRDNTVLLVLYFYISTFIQVERESGPKKKESIEVFLMLDFLN